MSIDSLESSNPDPLHSLEITPEFLELEVMRAEAVGSIITAVDWGAFNDTYTPLSVRESQDIAKRNYTRAMGDAVNASLLADQPLDDGQIAYGVVSFLTKETQRRWQAYTAFIEGANFEDLFIERLREEEVSLDWTVKFDEVANSWARFIDGYSQAGVEQSPPVRLEYVRTKLTWDLAKEQQLLSRAIRNDKAAA